MQDEVLGNPFVRILAATAALELALFATIGNWSPSDTAFLVTWLSIPGAVALVLSPRPVDLTWYAPCAIVSVFVAGLVIGAYVHQFVSSHFLAPFAWTVFGSLPCCALIGLGVWLRSATARDRW